MTLKRVLVIDDDAMILEFLTYALRSFGLAAIPAGNGTEGLDKAVAEQPDLILCDIHMPNPDGYEVRQRLAMNPRTAAIPVFAITALALPGDKEKILGAGFQGYISKPVELEDLARTVKSAVTKDEVTR